jgi:hypothetical protein
VLTVKTAVLGGPPTVLSSNILHDSEENIIGALEQPVKSAVLGRPTYRVKSAVFG